jgi:glycyl-tRNA synthetase (class II)
MEDGTVTLRDRDSMAQVRLRREALVPALRNLIGGTTSFVSLSP